MIDGESRRQYKVDWVLNGEGKGEMFENRSGLFKLVRQLNAIGIPYTVTRITLSKLIVQGE